MHIGIARTSRAISSVALSLAAVSARAEGWDNELFGGEPLTPKPDQYTVRFEASAYYAAPGGQLRLPGSSGAPDIKLEDLDLDRPRLSPYGELHIRSGDWRVALSGFAVSLNDVGVAAPGAMQIGSLAVAPGDQVTSSINFATGDAVLGRQLGFPERSPADESRYALSTEAFGGVRFYHVDFDFSTPAGSTSADEFYIQPIVGLKATLNIIDHFDIDLQVLTGGFATGGGHTSFSLEVVNGYTWRPIENVGVQIGYRLSYYSLHDGSGASEFDYSGAVAGLFAGVVIRF